MLRIEKTESTAFRLMEQLISDGNSVEGKKIYANIFCFQPQFFASLLGNCKRCWGSRPKNNNFPIKTENHFGLNDYQKSSRFLGILFDYILVYILAINLLGYRFERKRREKFSLGTQNLVANNVERMNN